MPCLEKVDIFFSPMVFFKKGPMLVINGRWAEQQRVRKGLSKKAVKDLTKGPLAKYYIKVG